MTVEKVKLKSSVSFNITTELEFAALMKAYFLCLIYREKRGYEISYLKKKEPH